MINFSIKYYKKVSKYSKIPLKYLKGELENTFYQDKFPGFILPAFVNDKIFWYAIACNQNDWRELNPILYSFVGQTYTTYNGEPSELNAEIEVESYLKALNVHAVVRLEPSNEIMLTVRALERMMLLFLAKPMNLRPPNLSTGQMITFFDMCLVDGDREASLLWLNRLKEEIRLDSLNLSFTNIKFNASFRDWTSIIIDPSFAELCRVNKPIVIAHYLLESLWYKYMECKPKGSEERRIAYENHCKIFIADIIASSNIMSSCEQKTFEEYFNIIDNDDEVCNIDDTYKPEDTSYSENTFITKKNHMFSNNDNKVENSSVSSQKGVVLSNYLNVIELDKLKKFISHYKKWYQLIISLDDQNFKFKDAAEEIVLNKNVTYLNESDDVIELEEALFNLNTEREIDRLTQILPQLIKWLKNDDNYPSKLNAPIYSIVLLRLIESFSRENQFREGITEMFAALLEVGLSGDQYKGLLNEFTKVIPDGAGTSDVFWLLDNADLLCRFSAFNESERNILLNKILGSLQTVMQQFSPMQQSAYVSVAKLAGWHIKPEMPTQENYSFAKSIKGKLIGIYTLTENSGRRVADVLNRITSDVRVEISCEKVCTPKLSRLSKNADFMVITSSSATHAATDCIHANRDSARIIYAAGRGYCSILRSLEEKIISEKL